MSSVQNQLLPGVPDAKGAAITRAAYSRHMNYQRIGNARVGRMMAVATSLGTTNVLLTQWMSRQIPGLATEVVSTKLKLHDCVDSCRRASGGQGIINWKLVVLSSRTNQGRPGSLAGTVNLEEIVLSASQAFVDVVDKTKSGTNSRFPRAVKRRLRKVAADDLSVSLLAIRFAAFARKEADLVLKAEFRTISYEAVRLSL